MAHFVLLHHAGEQSFSRTGAGKYEMVSPASVTTALQTLAASDVREVIKLPSGKFRFTDLGSKRIREKLPDKLLLT